MSIHKDEVIRETLEHPILQDAIRIETRNWMQWRREYEKNVREVLENIAMQIAGLICDSVPPEPDISRIKWREDVVNAAYIAIRFDALRLTIAHDIAVSLPTELNVTEENLMNGLHSSTIANIAHVASGVASMIFHGLDPALLMLTDEEREAELHKILNAFDPTKVIELPDDIDPIDVLIELEKRMREEEEDGDE